MAVGTIKSTSTIERNVSGRPIQLLSWDEKQKDDFAIMKETASYYIDQAVFNRINPIDPNLPTMATKKSLFEAYNGVLPQDLFDYVANPLATTKPEFKKFPAKIRMYNILRPSIDLLIGEWNKRGFKYDVINADGDEAFNSFLYVKEQTYKANIEQRFLNALSQELDNGENIPTDEELPSPREVIEDLNVNYKDEKALKGYKALKVLELELRLKETWRRLLKDWLISGEAYTYKFPHLGDIEYNRVSPLWEDHDPSNLSPYVEDGEWAVLGFLLTPSEVVDFFYNELEEKDVKEHVENASALNKRNSRYYSQFMEGLDPEKADGKVDVYFATWKSKKKIGILKYFDPFTGEELLDTVDEDYKADPELGEEVTWIWVNEVWGCWRIGDHKYVRCEPVRAQRNEMNNFSKCKLPVNGKKFSDTEAINTSVLAMGLPYQIMYIILMYRIELTVARSKGKIVLMDQNVIDDEDGEDHFIYYAEALGWALVNRDQEGVDKGWNQYTVLDLSLYNEIKELIGIAEWVKQQWDELLGITPQRKGQGAASEGLGVTQTKIFRSSVISDVIFSTFEEFLECEVQGLLDLTKFAWADGKKGNYRNDDGRLEFFAVEPEDYVNSDYSVFAIDSAVHQDKFNRLQDQVNAIAQRKDVKTSTIVDLVWTESITELKAKLKKAEAIEQGIIERNAKSESERAAQLEQLKREYDIFMHKLEVDKLHQEWDRKDNNEIIKASLDKDAEAPIDTGYLADVEKMSIERLDRMEKNRIASEANRIKDRQVDAQLKKIATDYKIAKEKNETALKNKVSGEK